MTTKTFKVTMTYPGTNQMGEQVYVEANNAPQARKRAEAQYCGKAHGANQVG